MCEGAVHRFGAAGDQAVGRSNPDLTQGCSHGAHCGVVSGPQVASAPRSRGAGAVPRDRGTGYDTISASLFEFLLFIFVLSVYCQYYLVLPQYLSSYLFFCFTDFFGVALCDCIGMWRTAL